ncbi:MAG: hypothetical protein ACRCST_04370 [Turicibacter sp.]
MSLANQTNECMACNGQYTDGSVVAAHSNQLRDGKGRGLKAHDYRIAFLCQQCHYRVDQCNSLDRAAKLELWEEAHRKTMGWLFEQGYLSVNTHPRQ